MNFSTVPPWCSTTARISSKYRAMTARTDSASRRSPRAVEPATSEKTTVIVFRTSRAAGAGAASGAAQARQNRASPGFP
jgi:hypothetical protein